MEFVIASRMDYLAEKHLFFPSNQFGGLNKSLQLMLY